MLGLLSVGGINSWLLLGKPSHPSCMCFNFLKFWLGNRPIKYSYLLNLMIVWFYWVPYNHYI